MSAEAVGPDENSALYPVSQSWGATGSELSSATDSWVTLRLSLILLFTGAMMLLPRRAFTTVHKIAYVGALSSLLGKYSCSINVS